MNRYTDLDVHFAHVRLTHGEWLRARQVFEDAVFAASAAGMSNSRIALACDWTEAGVRALLRRRNAR